MTIRAPAASRGSASWTSASGASDVDLVDARAAPRAGSRRARGCGLGPSTLALLTSRSIGSPAASTRRRRCSGSATSPAIGDDAVEARDRALERVSVTRVDDEPPAALDESAGEREPEAARGAGDDAPARSGLHRDAVARDDPVVVEAQQLDHVADVVLVLDPARPEARLAGEDRVVLDPPAR